MKKEDKINKALEVINNQIMMKEMKENRPEEENQIID